MGMLARFLDLLFPLRNTARIVATCTDEAVGRLLSPLHISEDSSALLPYRHPLVRALILEAKFKRNRRAQKLLGAVLTEYLASYTGDHNTFERQRYVAVAIPLSAKRLQERGYNQVEEIARAGGVRTEAVLKRTRDTVAQTTLRKRERLTNMEGAFAVTGEIDPSRTYIVIDDVSTTGATLHAAIETLRRAGAQRVHGIALTH